MKTKIFCDIADYKTIKLFVSYKIETLHFKLQMLCSRCYFYEAYSDTSSQNKSLGAVLATTVLNFPVLPLLRFSGEWLL